MERNQSIPQAVKSAPLPWSKEYNGYYACWDIRAANDATVAALEYEEAADLILQAVNERPALLAALRIALRKHKAEMEMLTSNDVYLPALARHKLEQYSKVLEDALAGTPPPADPVREGALRYAAGRVIRAYNMSDERAGISGQDELDYAINNVLQGALSSMQPDPVREQMLAALQAADAWFEANGATLSKSSIPFMKIYRQIQRAAIAAAGDTATINTSDQ